MQLYQHLCIQIHLSYKSKVEIIEMISTLPTEYEAIIPT